ncbi:MAG TPA: hypothetical protein VHM19_11335 [Polyangiales bacterium]|jgi:TPR repeat protein|nr:hypothetical protein [Polyangiales bacterium]
MTASACHLCGAALGPSPLYSPAGDLVCDSCHQRSVSDDRVETQAAQLASAAVVAGCVSFFINPAALISIGAIVAAVRAYLRTAQKTTRYTAMLGVALGLIASGMTGYDLWKVTAVQEDDLARSLRLAREATQAGRTDDARNALSDACKLKDANACYELANSYTRDSRYTEAREPLNTACLLDDGKACYLLGTFYENGNLGGVDTSKARLYYERACKLGETIACTRAEDGAGTIPRQ